MANLIVTEIQGTAEIMEKELIKTPVFAYMEELKAIGASIITNVQFKHSILNYHRKGGQTRRYHSGQGQSTESGKVEKVTLETSVCTAFYADNIQDYQKVDLDGNEPKEIEPHYRWPAAEAILQGQADSFGEDIYMNLFHGDKTLGEDHPLGMFDGLYTQIKKAETAGKIGTSLGNKVAIGAISAPADDTDTEAYDKALAFYNGLNPLFKKAKEIIFLMTDTALSNIMAAQTNKFKQSPFFVEGNINAGVKLLGASNVKMITSPSMGSGDLIIAYLPGGWSFGVYDESSDSYVRVTADPVDGNKVNTQIQSVVGVRLNDTRARVFAISDGSLTAPDQLSGDYSEASISATVKVAANGTVAITNANGDVITSLVKGEAATLTVTPASGKTFGGWSDVSNSSALNPRTVYGTGLPAAFEALVS